jgi:hypothetical protein
LETKQRRITSIRLIGLRLRRNNMSKFTAYASHVEAPLKVHDWVTKNLTDDIDTTEGEHIIDYLISSDAPSRISGATFDQMKSNADKWLKAQIKKGNNIKELATDTETVLDFDDGFRMVRLVGENAYKREGFLMSHCVASYYGKSAKIYSLRDKDNMPHCTIEEDQQIKGKGNGDISPKYIDYVVRFLESINMTAGDSEMKHLGYVNISNIKDEHAIFDKTLTYRDIYYPKNKINDIKDSNGGRYQNMTLWGAFGLFSLDANLKVKFNFYIKLSIETFKKFIKSGGNGSQLVGGYDTQLAGGNWAQLAGGNEAQLAGGDRAQLAGGYGSQLAGGNGSQLAGGNGSQLAGGNWAQLTLNGANAVSISGRDSRVRGVVGSWFVLPEYNNANDIIKMHTARIDGEKYKEMTFYWIKDGEITEYTD